MSTSLFRFSTAAMALASAAMAQVETQAPTDFTPVNPDDYYNPGEERRSFDLIMKPYPIPVRTTTYVDFVFNIPDDAPDLFHVTLGEVVNSHPLHLHHFVLTGCSKKIDEDQQGLPFTDNRNEDCIIPLGGWAPGGNVFGNTDLSAGVLMGRGMGVQAVLLNVHYTDGVYEDEETKTHKMATDGIRVHYIPQFRPYTTVQKALIDVGFGPSSLTIPPGEERFFLSRTCRVNTSCKDETPENLRQIARFIGMDEATGGMDLSQIACPLIKPFCGIGGDMGPWIQRFCPESCGFCDKTDSDGNPIDNPLNPDSYRITSIHYHAHLLGTEMYTTLLQEADSEADGTTAIQRDGTPTIVKDLESRDFWYYDNQETIPLPYDTFKGDELMRGTEIKIGDKIQATCVYNSSYRTDPTIFSLSTYDEMCITTAMVTFDTPASLLASDEGSCCDEEQVATLARDLTLMRFECDRDDAEFDVYSGTLTAGEDGRNIWKDHPIDLNECTYPVSTFGLGLYSSRNCDSDGGADFGDAFEGSTGDGSNVCRNMGDDYMFMSDERAGATCTGGTYDQQDQNSGVTRSQCMQGGGAWQRYTCGEVDHFFIFQADLEGMSTEVQEYLITNWYEPKCCVKPEQLAGASICGVGSFEFMSDEQAGAFCSGGTYDEGDQNSGVTETQCTEGGGEWTPYTCEEAGYHLTSEEAPEPDVAEYLKANWWKPKCCKEPEQGANICGVGGFEFMSDEQAGAACTGGTKDEEDLNTGVTETQCTEGGGVWTPYTCEEADLWLSTELALQPDVAEYLKANWWKPKCCKKSEQLEGDNSESPPEDELEIDNSIVSGARGSSSNISLLMAAAGVAAAFLL